MKHPKESMKQKIITTLWTALFLFCAFTVSAAPEGKDISRPQHKWRVQQLHKDNNEGIAVGDIDGDGKLDITAGEFWYQAPDFKQLPDPQDSQPFGADYLSEQLRTPLRHGRRR